MKSYVSYADKKRFTLNLAISQAERDILKDVAKKMGLAQSQVMRLLLHQKNDELNKK